MSRLIRHVEDWKRGENNEQLNGRLVLVLLEEHSRTLESLFATSVDERVDHAHKRKAFAEADTAEFERGIREHQLKSVRASGGTTTELEERLKLDYAQQQERGAEHSEVNVESESSAASDELPEVRAAAMAMPRIVRAEGIAECMPPIGICFWSTSEEQPLEVEVTIDVVLNVNVTNRVVNDLADVSLTLGFEGAEFEPSVRRGRVVSASVDRFKSSSTVRFDDVKISAPKGRKLIQAQISNIRANPSMMGVPRDDSFGGTRILALISIVESFGLRRKIPVLNELVELARPILGHIVTTSDPELFKRTELNERLGLGEFVTGLDFDFTVSAKEGFLDAFRSAYEELRYAPLLRNNDLEPVRLGPKPSIWRQGQGIRFLLRVLNTPEAIRVFVTARSLEADRNGQPCARLLLGTSGNGVGGTFAREDSYAGRAQNEIPMVEIRQSGGFGMAVWEWISGDPDSWTTFDQATFGVALARRDGGRITDGSMQACLSFAPLSTIVVADRTEPFPRFIDTGGDPSTVCSFFSEETLAELEDKRSSGETDPH